MLVFKFSRKFASFPRKQQHVLLCDIGLILGRYVIFSLFNEGKNGIGTLFFVFKKYFLLKSVTSC